MLDVSKIPETMKLRDRGSLLTGLIAGLADHEHAVAMVCVKTEEMAKKGDFLFITKNGQVKRTAAAEYGIRRARFAAINLKGEDDLEGLPGWSIECKRYATITPGLVAQWWAQAQRQAQATGAEPVLLYRADRGAWRAVWSASLMLPLSAPADDEPGLADGATVEADPATWWMLCRT